MSDSYPELLQDARDQVAAIARDHGLTDDAAAGLAHQVAEHLRRHWGGQLIYIPQGARYDRERRADAIYERFDGRNAPELMREYSISKSEFYRIINTARTRAVARRQRDLDL